MATQITSVKVPLGLHLVSGSAAGTLTISVYEGGPNPGAVTTPAVGTSTVNVSALPPTTSTSDNWADHNISEAQWTTFTLASPITVDPTAVNYVIGLSFSGITNNEMVFIRGLKAVIAQLDRYDFVSDAWEDSYLFPDRFFSCKIYAGTVVIGEVAGGDDFASMIWNAGAAAYFYNTRTTPYEATSETNIGYWAQVNSAPLKPSASDPADDATGVDTSRTALSWTPGDGQEADYYEIYFDGGNGTLPSTPTAVSFTPDFIIGLSLLPSTTYLWRVDAVNLYGTTTGDEWEFTTEATAFYVPFITQPTVWFSEVNDYENFKVGIKDSNSFEIVICSTNEIQWIEANESLLVGTAGDEWVISSNKLETPLTPTNFSSKQQSSYGSKYLQPRKVNQAVLFVDPVGRKVREMVFLSEAAKFDSPDMTSLAEHITKSGIVCMAYQKNPDSILWCVLADGSLVSMVYDREQGVVAWSNHPIDGLVQSVCVTPGTTEDEVWISVQRTIDDNDVIYIEKFAAREFGTDLEDAFFVDSGIVVEGTSATISELDHLEGKVVAAHVDGVYAGTFTVSASGEITLPAAPTAKTIVGLPFTYSIQPMRLVSGGGGGTTQGSILRPNELVLSFYESLGAEYGLDASALYAVDFADIRASNFAEITGLFTGEVVVAVPPGYDPQFPILISGNDTNPCLLRSIIARFDVTGR